MTRAKQSDLVLDGNVVKLRLQAERQFSGQLVHVDWVRFTAQLRNAPIPDADDLFPLPKGGGAGEVAMRDRLELLTKILRNLPDGEFAASVQAKSLAQRVCEALGPEFSVYPEVRKGHDFYRFRWSIVRNEAECGWVGYLSSGDSPRQLSQAKTIHCNLYGAACTFAVPGFNLRLADLIDETESVLTRADLALDFFDGIAGGMERVRDDYTAGAMNVFGKRPSCNWVGDWSNGKGRSFYVGSKEAGKQTNVYEKGHQLFGVQDPSRWVRAELRYGNKLRVLPSDMLRRPADFFAGASDWHEAVLKEATPPKRAMPEVVSQTAKLKSQTVLAAVTRNVKWLRETAAPSMSLAFQHLGMDEFLELVLNKKAPASLQSFSQNEVAAAYSPANKRASGSGAGHAGFQPA